MRIAIVTHNVIRGDGQGRANYELARACCAAGHDVTLVASEVDSALLGGEIRWVRIRPRLFSRVHLFKVKEFTERANSWARRHAADFDIVHATGYCLSVPHQVNTSQFVHAAWLQSPVHTSRLVGGWYGLYHRIYSVCNSRWEQQCYSRARAVVAVSNQVRRELEGVGVAATKLSVIHNGADLTEFHPGVIDRAALGLPVDVPLALFAGDIKTPRKNLDTVLKAFAQMSVGHLVVVGRLEGSPFPALAEQLGIAHRVHFLGFRRDIADLMRAVDLFVFPSRYEACALVLAEALASGLPVVSSVATGGAELVTPECGILIEEAADVGALAAAMNKIFGDSPLRKAMSRAARLRAEGIGWDIITAQYLSLYESLVP